MDNTGKQNENLDAKPIIYGRHGAADEPDDEDFTVRKVSKKFIVLVVGLVLIPFIVYFISRLILPIMHKETFAGVNLTYWGPPEDEEAFKKLIYDFEIQHPNIKVKYEKQDIKTLKRYIERLTTRISNGTGPDVMRIHNTWPMALRSYLLPLPQDVINGSEISTKYYNVVNSDMKIRGAYYAIPHEMDTLALFINDAMFKETGLTVPTSWDDLAKAADAMAVPEDSDRAKTKIGGIAMGLYDNVDHATDIVSLLMASNNVNLYQLDDPAALKSAADALMLYVSFAKPNSKGVMRWDDTFDRSTVSFARGKVAMIFGYSKDVFEIKKENPDLQFSVYPVPHVPQRNVTIASYWAEAVSGRTTHPAEAFEFLKFLSMKENLEKYNREIAKMQLFGKLYPRRDMATMLSDNKLIYPFIAQADYAVSTPYSSNTYDSAMNEELVGLMGNGIKAAYANAGYEFVIGNLGSASRDVIKKYVR